MYWHTPTKLKQDHLKVKKSQQKRIGPQRWRITNLAKTIWQLRIRWYCSGQARNESLKDSVSWNNAWKLHHRYYIYEIFLEFGQIRDFIEELIPEDIDDRVKVNITEWFRKQDIFIKQHILNGINNITRQPSYKNYWVRSSRLQHISL